MDRNDDPYPAIGWGGRRGDSLLSVSGCYLAETRIQACSPQEAATKIQDVPQNRSSNQRTIALKSRIPWGYPRHPAIQSSRTDAPYCKPDGCSALGTASAWIGRI